MLLLSPVVVACSSATEISEVSCPPEGTKLTYESFGRDYLAANCQTCHGRGGSERKGAPSDYDFGTVEGVQKWRSRIFARAAGDNVTMPPGPDDPPREGRAKLSEWLACGAP